MSLTKTKGKRKSAAKKTSLKKEKPVARKSMSNKRKQAIEKAIAFWKTTQIDLTGFSFNREEANAR
jgi:hypothetical protein